MNFSKYNFLSLIAIMFFAFSACNDDEPIIEEPVEIITTVNYTLTPAAGGDAVVLSFRDIDGDGGNAPVITGGTLTAGTSYTGSLELLNESEDPAEDITSEIQEEDLDHQFFFNTTVPGLQISYTDMDSNGNPLGLATTIQTEDAGAGTLTIILRHLPVKDAAGVSDGDITNAEGETDIEVTFDVVVQ